MSVPRRLWTGAIAVAIAVAGLPLLTATAPAQAAQPLPNHAGLVPDVPRKDTPRIGNGEIWDIEVVGSRVFIAGSFTSLANTTGNNRGTVSQRYLASYNINTGLIDTSFRPTFNGGVGAVEASPDGTKLYVGGTFNTVNGVARQKIASLNLTTGAPTTEFATTKSTNNAVTALAATNSTVYAGGKFSRINGELMTGLAALNGTTGAVDSGFDNQLSGGIGVNGALTVQQLKLTHDDSKLLVVHTGRKIDGEDRLGIGIVSTSTKQLLPWRTRLWDEYLPIVGGVQRIYAGDIAPNDQYFVVGSGSGGDRPPISDTAIAFDLSGGDNQQPLWISRMFDSIYSVAITEEAVYVGGHFGWNESPSANQPWPGLDNVGYGTGQGLSGYGLGDQVVRREHIGALDPQTGTALEWNPWSNSFEGNKAMEATSRGLFVGGDGMFQGGVRTGRVAFYDFNSVPAPTTTDTTIDAPIEGRVVTSGLPFTIQGRATNPQGIRRVQVWIQDSNTKRYLQDDGVTWGGNNNILASLGTGTTNREWALPATITGNHNLKIMAKTIGTNGAKDATKATKKIESFSFDDQTPTTGINGPSGVQTSTSFTMTGTANDDHGVNSLSYWFRDEDQNYLQNDGTVGPIFNSFRGTPDVVGATSATWSYDVTLPHEGIWRGSATAVDTAGQADLRSAVRDWRVDSTAVAPTMTITQPAAMIPGVSTPTVIVQPGSPVAFSGTATDDDRLKNVEIYLRNTSTGASLGADGTFGVGVAAGWHRISPASINAASYNWSYTTPFNVTPGSYDFRVRATDTEDLTTATSGQGRLTLNAQILGDDPPNGTLTPGGTITVIDPQITLGGTATDDRGVETVRVQVFDYDTGRYLQNNGQMSSDSNRISATLETPNATSTAWSLPITLPTGGDYGITAYAFDTAGQQDPSTSGATARYKYYPGDSAPTFEVALGQPVDGSIFTEGRIIVSGRAVDDISMARVDVGIIDSSGRYMNSSGGFSSANPSWRPAFLNSPGSPGSNFSYTTPVIPDGTYTVLVRPTDHHDQIGEVRTSVGVVVTRPANDPPVANATVSCTQNVCSFDGRSSTDENPTALTYSWNTGQGSASGPVPTKTYNRPGTYTPTLTVADEWNVTSTVFTLPPITITEPTNNVAPAAQIGSNCIALACATSSAGTADPNAGDTLSYLWNFGDGTATSTSSSPSHTYAAPGSYTLTLTVTDGWGKETTVSQNLNLTEPGANQPPNVTFTTRLHRVGLRDEQHRHVRSRWRPDPLLLELGRCHVSQYGCLAVAHLRQRGHLHHHLDGD